MRPLFFSSALKVQPVFRNLQMINAEQNAQKAASTRTTHTILISGCFQDTRLCWLI